MLIMMIMIMMVMIMMIMIMIMMICNRKGQSSWSDAATRCTNEGDLRLAVITWASLLFSSLLLSHDHHDHHHHHCNHILHWFNFNNHKGSPVIFVLHIMIYRTQQHHNNHHHYPDQYNEKNGKPEHSGTNGSDPALFIIIIIFV